MGPSNNSFHLFGHVLLLLVATSLWIHNAEALSLKRTHKVDGIQRRNALEYMTALVAGPGIFSAGVPGYASAADDITKAATQNFATYNVIPDASATLNPKLVEVNVSQ